MARLQFGISVLTRILQGQSRSCPYCNSNDGRLLARKKLLLELRKCGSCGLMFRYPKDDAQTSRRFYQEAYREGDTTDLPNPEELARLLKTGFHDNPALDLSGKIALFRTVIPSGSVLDFGASWGYGVHQLREAGYQAFGYEVSVPRAKFGADRLGVSICSTTDDLIQLAGGMGKFDAVFSSHVLEHVPDLRGAFSLLASIIRPGGTLVAFVPNGGGELARTLGVAWGPMIGEKHCVALDGSFFAQQLPKFGFSVRLASAPYTTPAAEFVGDNQPWMLLKGDELAVFAQRLPVVGMAAP